MLDDCRHFVDISDGLLILEIAQNNLPTEIFMAHPAWIRAGFP